MLLKDIRNMGIKDWFYEKEEKPVKMKKSIKEDNTLKKEKKSYWIIYLIYGLVSIGFILGLIGTLISGKSYILRSEQLILFLIKFCVFTGMASLFGFFCKDMAKDYNANQGVGFMIGFLFSLIGYICYSIYLTSKEKGLNS